MKLILWKLLCYLRTLSEKKENYLQSNLFLIFLRKVYDMTCFFNGFVSCLLLHVCLFLVFKEHTKTSRMFNHNTKILKFCPKTLCYRACFQFFPWGENNLKCLINYYIISSKNEAVFNCLQNIRFILSYYMESKKLF